MKESSKYIPAMGYFSLARWYDPLSRLFMPEKRLKSHLIQLAQIPEIGRVLDVGCGTGTLLLMVKSLFPQAALHGLDGDALILEVARKKFKKNAVQIDLEQAMAYAMPYEAASFDRVLSSLALHHLSPDDRQRALSEIKRVLSPAGELHVLDFSGGHMQHGHLRAHFAHTADQSPAYPSIPVEQALVAAGFSNVRKSAETRTIMGKLEYLSALKAG